MPFIDRFLKERFADGPVTLSCLSARDVVRFVQRQAPRLHQKRAKLMTTALRSFLHYAQYRGGVGLDLAAAVPVVANWSMPAIPRAISADQVRQLLASIDQRTAMGRRDYAMLLLLARLGLRSSEVVGLDLDDIDWNRATLTVRGKGGLRHEFPMSPEVGQAIAAYLSDGRPQSTSRRVFLRTKAPIRGFRSASGVGSIGCDRFLPKSLCRQWSVLRAFGRFWLDNGHRFGHQVPPMDIFPDATQLDYP